MSGSGSRNKSFLTGHCFITGIGVSKSWWKLFCFFAFLHIAHTGSDQPEVFLYSKLKRYLRCLTTHGWLTRAASISGGDISAEANMAGEKHFFGPRRALFRDETATLCSVCSLSFPGATVLKTLKAFVV